MPTRIVPNVKAVPAVRSSAPRRAVPRQAPAPAAAVQPESSGLDPAEIARLAYSYWEARGGEGGGSSAEDWFRAENELRARSLC
jgi:hypothetical protein